jgi:hypothetical protein
MEPELTKLFEIRVRESRIISVESDSYGKIPLLLYQGFRHKDQPIVQDAIAQRLDILRTNLGKIAEKYRQIYHTTSKKEIRTAAKSLEDSTLSYVKNIEKTFFRIQELLPCLDQ